MVVELEIKEWVVCLSKREKNEPKAEKKNKVKKATGVNFNFFLLHFHILSDILNKTREY